jgi:hypothetical protein
MRVNPQQVEVVEVPIMTSMVMVGMGMVLNLGEEAVLEIDQIIMVCMEAGRYLGQVVEVVVLLGLMVLLGLAVLLEIMVKPIMLFILLVVQVPQTAMMDGIIH